jgi:hypothetical protein
MRFYLVIVIRQRKISFRQIKEEGSWGIRRWMMMMMMSDAY